MATGSTTVTGMTAGEQGAAADRTPGFHRPHKGGQKRRQRVPDAVRAAGLVARDPPGDRHGMKGLRGRPGDAVIRIFRFFSARGKGAAQGCHGAGCRRLPRSGYEEGKEFGQVGVMVVDMRGGQRIGGDVDGAHPHGMGGCQIARIILEHRGAAGCQAIGGEDGLEGGPLGLWQEACMFHPVDGIEEIAQAAGRKHAFGVGRATVGINDAPPGRAAMRRARTGSASRCASEMSWTSVR